MGDAKEYEMESNKFKEVQFMLHVLRAPSRRKFSNKNVIY